MELFDVSNMSMIVMIVGLCFLVGSGTADVPMFSTITNPIKGGQKSKKTNRQIKTLKNK